MTATTFGNDDTNKPEYRFVGTIVDANTNEVVCKSSTYLSDISPTGECESVDIEVADLLRHFRREKRADFERAHYPQEESDND
jgi:hypothetical protein